ncbi:MAG: PTS sugar transporter subunit IIA [Spirochaetaceae bacterium]|nr:MAG: PTS sugar transporter subunit IIA [Spirochaetaceae bacterium]
MNLKKALSPAVVRTGMVGRTKEEIIDEMIEVLASTGKISDVERARAAIRERERKMSTGMEHGIAIPHGKTDAVTELLACVGVTAHDVDFGALDGKPSRIFIMTLSPVDRTGPHIQFLAEISQLLRSADKRQKLLEASSPDALLKALLA